MIKKLLIFLIFVMAAVLIAGALAPAEMLVSREMVIAASAEKIFPYINNSEKSYDWMPWAEGDPSIKITYSGPSEGVGAKSSWKGDKMGVGMSEVVESETDKIVKTKLTYTEPFDMSQMAEISLTPSANGTLVKWSVSGHKNFFFRLMGLFINCDDMIGGEFDKGLSKLKSITEGS